MYPNQYVPRGNLNPELDETECSDMGAYYSALESEDLLEYYAQTRYSGSYSEDTN